MAPGLRRLIIRFSIFLVRYGLLMLVIYWIGMFVHEWFHLITLKALGGDGYILMVEYGFLLGAVITTTSPASHLWLFFFAGGFGTFILFFIPWFLIWKFKGLVFLELELTLFSSALIQLSISFAEVLLYKSPYLLYILGERVALSAGFYLGMGVYLKKIIEWVDKKN